MAMSVLGYETVNDRIITIRIQGRALNLTIIQVYAPTTEASESDIEDFYSSLQETFDAAPSKDIKLLIGDFNAKVGCSLEPSIIHINMEIIIAISILLLLSPWRF